jgi:hypothetical protein
VYVSGIPTGTMSLDHFYIRPHSLSAAGVVTVDWQNSFGTLSQIVPSTPTPIWKSTEAHASVNVLSLDLEVRDLANCIDGTGGVALTFYVVPNP